MIYDNKMSGKAQIDIRNRADSGKTPYRKTGKKRMARAKQAQNILTSRPH